MKFESLALKLLPAVEQHMEQVVAGVAGPATSELHAMLAYHMGWEGEGAGPKARGKRVRPLLVLLCAGAAGGKWQDAVPAAASVELLHNFSLIHDDIEDDSPLRRGRTTLWKKWGLAQGINAGDTLYTLAYTAMLGMNATCGPGAAVDALDVLQRTCISLTQGQYLDLSFENRAAVSVEAYFEMIGGKTAALLAACTELGALAAGAAEGVRAAYRDFGRYLGLAFQVQDDLLGIWGDPAITGKSAASDLAAGKKSLPVLHGLGQNGAFAARWKAGPISESQAASAAGLLEESGALEFTQSQAGELTARALDCLEKAGPSGESGQALEDLAGMLLQRRL